MARGYVIAQTTVTEPTAHPAPVAGVHPILDGFGARFLVRGGRSEFQAGPTPAQRTVVSECLSDDAARDWRHAPAYAEAKAMRRAASFSVQTIAEGVEQ